MNRSDVKSVKRLSSDERRAAIIKAVRQVFAEKGFDGTTTRELASAAGVSEALLFKHFPDKESLYSAMQHACCSEHDLHRVERIKALEPSALTLVLLVHMFVSSLLAKNGPDDDKTIHKRLMLRSLAEDGEFARQFLQGLPTQLNHWLAASLEAAIRAGDAYDGPVETGPGAWFAHHLTAMIKCYNLPATTVLDLGISHAQVVEQAVWFCLRGMGLKEETIRRDYNPKALALFSE